MKKPFLTKERFKNIRGCVEFFGWLIIISFLMNLVYKTIIVKIWNFMFGTNW